MHLWAVLLLISLLACQTNAGIYDQMSFFKGAADAPKLNKLVEKNGTENLSDEERLLYAQSLLLTERYDDAKIQLQIILDKDAQNEKALYLMARLDYQTGNVEGSKKIVDSMLKIDPTNPQALSLNGDIAFRDKEYHTAIKNYTLSLEKDPNNVVTLIRLSTSNEILKKIDTAIIYLEEAEKINPDFDYLQTQKASLYLQNGNVPDALVSLDRAIELNPENPWAYLDRAEVSLSYGKSRTAARQDVEKALRLDPTNFKALAYQAGLNLDFYEFDEAEVNFKHLLEVNPSYFPAYRPLGEIAFLNKDYKTASYYLEKSVSAAPEDFYSNILLIASWKMANKDPATVNKMYSLLMSQRFSPLQKTILQYYYHKVGKNSVTSALAKEKNPYRSASYEFYLGLYDLIQPTPSAIDNKILISWDTSKRQDATLFRESWMANALSLKGN